MCIEDELGGKLREVLQSGQDNSAFKGLDGNTWNDISVVKQGMNRVGDYTTKVLVEVAYRNSIVVSSLVDWVRGVLRIYWDMEEYECVCTDHGYIQFISRIASMVVSFDSSSGIYMEHMGCVHSCFKEKYGTPRQGSLAPHTKGYIELGSKLDVECVDGMDMFSHLWVVFVFNANDGNKGWKFKSKITPPKLGSKVGVYSTRSPHRYNPIGISVVKLEYIDVVQGAVRVYISGLDIIDGTPVLDIKPYHPADNIQEDINIPDYVSSEVVESKLLDVHITDLARQQLASLLHRLELYSNEEDLLEAITECLRIDPRTVHSRSKHKDGFLYGMHFDELELTFDVQSNVIRLLYIETNSTYTLRTKDWSDRMITLLSN